MNAPEEKETLINTEFYIQNLRTKADTEHVNKIVMSINGVEEAKFDLKSHTATIRHNPGISPPELIQCKLNDLYYSAFIQPDYLDYKNKHKKIDILLLFTFMVAIINGGLMVIIGLLTFKYGYDQKLHFLLVYFGILSSIFLTIYTIREIYRKYTSHEKLDIEILVIFAIIVHVAINNWFDISLISAILSWMLLMSTLIRNKILSGLTGSRQYFFDDPTLFECNSKSKPTNIPVGSMIIVKTGDFILLDGTIVQGNASVDESSISGQSIPQEKTAGSMIYAGSYILKGNLVIQTTSDYGSSSLKKLKNIIDENGKYVPTHQNFFRLFCVIYSVVVAVITLITCIILLILKRHEIFNQKWMIAQETLVILTIVCPCGLCIAESLPKLLSIFYLYRKKFNVIKFSILHDLGQIKFVAFDKTGTLTDGQFRVLNCQRLENSSDKMLKYIAMGEFSFGHHPIAVAIYNYIVGTTDGSGSSSDKNMLYTHNVALTMYTGYGFSFEIDGNTIHLGNYEFMKKLNFITDKSVCLDQDLTEVFAAINGKISFIFYLFDTTRPSASDVVQKLRYSKIGVGIVSGDRRGPTYQCAKITGADEYVFSNTPKDKLNYIKDKKKMTRARVAIVGDGINDLPAMDEADVAICIGMKNYAMGKEICDCILTNEDLTTIADAMIISRKYSYISSTNIVIAILPRLMITGVDFYMNLKERIINKGDYILTDFITILIIIINSSRCLF